MFEMEYKITSDKFGERVVSEGKANSEYMIGLVINFLKKVREEGSRYPELDDGDYSFTTSRMKGFANKTSEIIWILKQYVEECNFQEFLSKDLCDRARDHMLRAARHGDIEACKYVLDNRDKLFVNREEYINQQEDKNVTSVEDIHVDTDKVYPPDPD